MGLFDKTELHTSSQTLQLMEDTPDILKQSAIGSVMKGTNIATDMVNTTINSFASQVRSMYRYARDKYTNGLPEGTVGRLAPPNDAALLRALLQERPVNDPNTYQILTSAIDSLNADNFAYEWLSLNTDWDPDTNAVTLDGLRMYYDSSKILAEDSLELKFIIPPSDPDGNPTYKLKKVQPVTPMISNHLYFVTVYHEVDPNGDTVGREYWWVYDEDSHKYPELTVPDKPVAHTQYLPVVPLRVNNVSYTAEDKHDTPLYKTSKSMLKKVDLSIEQLDEGVNNNPDIDSVDHAYLVFGIDVHTDKQESNRYLYEYFSDLAPISSVTKSEFEAWKLQALTDFTSTPPINVIDISDGTYKSKICYYYIDVELKKGKVCKVNDVVKTIKGGHSRMSIGRHNGAVSDLDVLILSKQVSETNYITITVSGLFHSNKIYGPNVDYISTLAMTEERSLIIPVNVSIVNKLPILHANTLYYDAFKIVFNAYEYVKLKWYQTGFFKFVTAIVAVALTIVSGVGGAFVQGLVAAAGAGVVALGVFLAETILMSVLTSVVVKFVIQELGGEIGLIIAALAVVIGGATYLPDVLQITNMSIGEIVGSEMQEIMQEMQTFTAEAEKMWEELEEVYNQLNTPSLFDPIGVFTEVDMYPGESYEGFYLRKTMNDPAKLSLDVVNKYYESVFYLPTT